MNYLKSFINIKLYHNTHKGKIMSLAISITSIIIIWHTHINLIILSILKNLMKTAYKFIKNRHVNQRSRKGLYT